MVTKKCIIITALAVIVGVVVAFGLYFGLPSRSKYPTNANLFIKMNNGVISQYDIYKNSLLPRIEEYILRITAFNYYYNNTAGVGIIYYANTEPYGPIYSTDQKLHPIIKQAQGWTKTAIAVDYVNKNLYVLDSLQENIYSVTMDDKYQNLVSQGVREALDIVLDVNIASIFVLHRTKISKVNMDGTKPTILINEEKGDFKAFTIDTRQHKLYFVNGMSIESFDYVTNERKTLITLDKKNVISLTIAEDFLFFIVEENTNENNSLLSCRLKDDHCENWNFLMKNEHMQDVKNFETITYIRKNPCETKDVNCEQLCLLSNNEKGYSCACTTGWTLNGDKNTCSKN